jgi:hypothetical protein
MSPFLTGGCAHPLTVRRRTTERTEQDTFASGLSFAAFLRVSEHGREADRDLIDDYPKQERTHIDRAFTTTS